MNVADPRAALIVSGRVGFVDVPDLAQLGVENLAIDLKLLRDVAELGFLIHEA